MTKIIILGATGGCAELISLIRRANDYGTSIQILCCLDDNHKQISSSIYGINVAGGFDAIAEYKQRPDIKFITAIGNSRNYKQRKKIIMSLGIPNEKWITLIDKDAYVSDYSEVGHGSVIYPGAYVGASVKLGAHTIIQSNSSIGHGTIVGSYSLINSGVQIGGDCNIGESCYFGLGAAIRDHLEIGTMSQVGMGAAVTANCESGCLYLGVPATKYVEN